MVARENYKRSAPRRAEILACAISYSKQVAVSESCELARVAYLSQITNIGSGCARKLYKERSREGWDISVRVCTRENGCRFRISPNQTCSTFRPNNEYWKQSHAKIIKGAHPGGLGYLCARLCMLKMLPSQNRAKSYG